MPDPETSALALLRELDSLRRRTQWENPAWVDLWIGALDRARALVEAADAAGPGEAREEWAFEDVDGWTKLCDGEQGHSWLRVFPRGRLLRRTVTTTPWVEVPSGADTPTEPEEGR